MGQSERVQFPSLRAPRRKTISSGMGAGPQTVSYPLSSGPNIPANAGRTTSCRGFESRSCHHFGKIAQLVERYLRCFAHSLLPEPMITPWRMLVELHFGCRGRGFESRSCYHGKIAQLDRARNVSPFLVARDQTSGISSGWSECRTWTAEVGGSNPPSLTIITGGMPVGLHHPNVSVSQSPCPPPFGCSSVAERLTVNQDVAGSTPTSRANNGR